MKKLKFIILIIVAGSLFACEKNSDYSNDLIGYWKNLVVEKDSIYTFERANDFDENDYGFSFQPGNVFIERKNAGWGETPPVEWCGTPPITYQNFIGNWRQKDSIIDISVKFRGGITNAKWKIIYLDKYKLTFYRLKIEHKYDKP